MKKSLKSAGLIQFCLILVLAAAAFSSNIMAQSSESNKGTKRQHECTQDKMVMNSKHAKMDMSAMKGSMTSVKDNDIVRKGVINLKAIDKNKDGKVFQDQMDWNVISDAPGKCPLCKMTLEEVTLKQAKENLTKNGFKVK
ncbi:MAG TPA: heavy metal-binding domain-containing protein [Ignavibacteriales bacterium]|nr:heavy metal-binding domain-containing protein [Ignavibacteriales bacterium]